MAYDEALAARMREVFGGDKRVSEQKSFGGLSFLLNGNMCCGALNEEIVVRVGPAAADDALSRPHARPMDFTGRPMKGWVYVAPEGVSDADDLSAWIKRGIEFASSLAAK